MSNVAPLAPIYATTIPTACNVRGQLIAQEDLLIEGAIDGEIEAPGHAVAVDAAASVRATVFARDVTIHGKLEGKVTAVEIVDIRDGATVAADIVAPCVLLADGAVFNGRIEMKRADAAVRVARYRMERRPSPLSADAVSSAYTKDSGETSP
jgi:cytoskeletal protein CcmA (bactofilin family)